MSHFKISWRIQSLRLKDVFTISRWSRSEVQNVFIALEKDGITGMGEAAPNKRYNEDAEKVVAVCEALPIGFFDDITTPEELEKKLNELNITVYSAKFALEMAWLDWWGKSKNQPLWKLWGAEFPVGPVSSYTIGIDSIEKMQEKLRAGSQYPNYKIKLGTDHDRNIIQAIRAITDKPIRVDANEGWKTVEQAQTEIEFLATQNVELIEQPMPSVNLEEMTALKKWSPIPLCADESFLGDEDLDEISEAFHVINIKLMKMGSLLKARRVLDEAHQKGLQVMIGCMIESSLADAASGLIALNAEYADLDGHLLIANNPYSGFKLREDGRVMLSDEPGFGVFLPK